MQQEIILSNKKVSYTLRRNRRAKSVRLSVGAGGALTVTIPYGIALWRAEKFLQEKADWVMRSIEAMEKRRADSIFSHRSKREYYKLKERARALAKNKVEYFSSLYGIRPGAIAIRNQKTRWGSCSKRGNLNFNYKIALLPGHLADYIVVHELCHIVEFNHSKRFWQLVAKAIPDYKARRREIKNL